MGGWASSMGDIARPTTSRTWSPAEGDGAGTAAHAGLFVGAARVAMSVLDLDDGVQPLEAVAARHGLYG
jgi:hypothetical protein